MKKSLIVSILVIILITSIYQISAVNSYTDRYYDKKTEIIPIEEEQDISNYLGTKIPNEIVAKNVQIEVKDGRAKVTFLSGGSIKFPNSKGQFSELKAENFKKGAEFVFEKGKIVEAQFTGSKDMKWTLRGIVSEIPENSDVQLIYENLEINLNQESSIDYPFRLDKNIESERLNVKYNTNNKELAILLGTLDVLYMKEGSFTFKNFFRDKFLDNGQVEREFIQEMYFGEGRNVIGSLEDNTIKSLLENMEIQSPKGGTLFLYGKSVINAGPGKPSQNSINYIDDPVEGKILRVFSDSEGLGSKITLKGGNDFIDLTQDQSFAIEVGTGRDVKAYGTAVLNKKNDGLFSLEIEGIANINYKYSSNEEERFIVEVGKDASGSYTLYNSRNPPKQGAFGDIEFRIKLDPSGNYNYKSFGGVITFGSLTRGLGRFQIGVPNEVKDKINSNTPTNPNEKQAINFRDRILLSLGETIGKLISDDAKKSFYKIFA